MTHYRNAPILSFIKNIVKQSTSGFCEIRVKFADTPCDHSFALFSVILRATPEESHGQYVFPMGFSRPPQSVGLRMTEGTNKGKYDLCTESLRIPQNRTQG